MRELDCDFCGARAVGAFEVVPAELDPALDEQVRVVLCESCRDTLDAVTAPLLARLGVGSGRSPDPADDLGGDTVAASATDPAQSTLQSGAAGGTEETDAEGDGSDEGPEDGAQASARAENPVSPADDAVIIDSGRRRPPRATEGANGRDSMDASDVAAVRRATAAEGDPDADESDGSDGTGDAADAETDDADAGEDPADAADDGGTDGEGPTVREYVEEPEEFRTVMRLLNNREFPVDRAEITDLASGAYELEVSQVEEIIDHAVDRGILAEKRGKLTKA